MIVESFVNYNPWNVRSPLRPSVLVHICYGQGEGCLKVANARFFFLAEIWDGELCAGPICHLILESSKKKTLQRKQYSHFDSFSVCFEVSFSVCWVLRFGISHIPRFRKKWRHRFLGKVDLWKRLGQASYCWAKALGRPACNILQPWKTRKTLCQLERGLFPTAMVHYALEGCLL